MDIKYNIIKLKGSIKEEVQDHVSVEEPLEMSLKFKIDDIYTPHPPKYPYGRFGKTQDDNDLYYDIFSKNYIEEATKYGMKDTAEKVLRLYTE